MGQMLYGNPSNSADDADVIALYLTEMVVTDDNFEGLQHLLSKAIRDRDNYVFNEEDSGLILKNIPAQLTHISEESPRKHFCICCCSTVYLEVVKLYS